MFVVFSVAFISLPENSNAETLMSSKKKVEMINDMAEKMQKDFDEMKSNFHKLEISNLMLKLQIHEIKDNFQEIINQRIKRLTRTTSRQYKDLRKRMVSLQNDQNSIINSQVKQLSKSESNKNESYFEEMASKVKDVNKKLASVANTMNLEKSSFQNDMQAIMLKTNSLDNAVQKLISKQNGDKLRFSNITEKIISLKDLNNCCNLTETTKNNKTLLQNEKLIQNLEHFAGLKMRLQSTITEVFQTRNAVHNLTNKINQFADVANIIVENKQTIDDVEKIFREQKNNTSKHISNINKHLSNLNKNFTIFTEKTTITKKQIMKDTENQLSMLNERVNKVANKKENETTTIKNIVNEVLSNYTFSRNRINKIEVEKNKIMNKLLDIIFKLDSFEKEKIQINDILLQLNNVTSKLKVEKTFFSENFGKLKTTMNRLSQKLHSLTSKEKINERYILNLTSFYDLAKDTELSIKTNIQDITIVRNNISSYKEDNKIKLDEFRHHTTSMINALHLISDRSNKLSSTLEEISQNTNENNNEIFAIKTDLDEVKNRSENMQRSIENLSTDFDKNSLDSIKMFNDLHFKIDYLNSNLTVINDTNESASAFVNQLYDDLDEKYNHLSNYSKSLSIFKTKLNTNFSLLKKSLLETDKKCRELNKNNTRDIEKIESDFQNIKTKEFPLLKETLIITLNESSKIEIDKFNKMLSKNIKKVNFKFNETYRSMDKLEKNITTKNKAFFEDYKSFCQELQIENKNEIDDFNKNVEKLETNYLTSCDVEEIQYGSHNSTALLRDGDFVEYSCYRGYKFRGEVPVRRCSNGVIAPSFHEEPLSCVISWEIGPNPVTFDKGIEYCKGINAVPMIKHMKDRIERQDLCANLEITKGGVRSGFVFRNGRWRNHLGNIVDNPVTNTYVKEGATLAIICNVDVNYGIFTMFPKETLVQPLCMYT